MNTSRRLLLSTLCLPCSLNAAPVPHYPPVPANGDLGFILTSFTYPITQNKDDCPNGLAGTIKENYLDTLPAAERARLSQPANAEQLKKLWQGWSLGPNHTNICTNVELFPDRPLQKLFQGKVADGLDLDHGKPACAHQEFTSPSGQRGIDNQAYRVMGCTRNYHGVDGSGGDVVKGYNMLLATGEHSMVLLVQGVKNFAHQDKVTVILASTDDKPILDSHQNFLTGVSYNVTHTSAWRNVLHGQINKGILTTDAADIRLRRSFGHGGLRGAKIEWDIHGARLQVSLLSDGSFKGILGGYQTPRSILSSTIAGGIGAALVAGLDCAAAYNALVKYADGGRDPKTGQCTMDSTALDVGGISAFVFDTPPVVKGGAQ